MALSTTAHHADYSSTTSSDATPPNHLGTNVPSGQFDGTHDPEKAGHFDDAKITSHDKKEVVGDDDDEDEDMDALIDDLESLDGQIAEEEEEVEAGSARPVPEELLQTDTIHGLTEAEVTSRRKKFGLNQMKEEKENLILKFLGYFVGPIQFVMEVSFFRGICGCLQSKHSPTDTGDQ